MRFLLAELADTSRDASTIGLPLIRAMDVLPNVTFGEVLARFSASLPSADELRPSGERLA